MKRIVLCVFLAAAVGGILFAQASGRQRQVSQPEKTTLNGKLGLSLGRIALESDGNTYYVMGIDRLIGFVDGLKEGAAVTLEGWASPLPRSENVRIFRATKLNFNGKDYELGSQETPTITRQEIRPGSGPFAPGPGFNQAPGFGPPSGCGPQQQAPMGRSRSGRR